MIQQNLFVDSMGIASLADTIELMDKAKIILKAVKALKNSLIQYQVWVSAYHNDISKGGVKLEIYDPRGMTIAGIYITKETQIETDFIVTRNRFKTYKEWVTYLKKAVKTYYKDQG